MPSPSLRFRPEDLRSLYGIRHREPAICDRRDVHAAGQIGRGRLVLMEVDSFHLSDMRGVSGRTGHGKGTVGINRIDRQARRLDQFHDGDYYTLADDDYTALFELRSIIPYAPFIPSTGGLSPSAGNRRSLSEPRHRDRRRRRDERGLTLPPATSCHAAVVHVAIEEGRPSDDWVGLAPGAEYRLFIPGREPVSGEIALPGGRIAATFME